MTIKRKDGTIFKLRSPNPIMLKQSLWDDDKSVIHNFNPVEVVTKEAIISEKSLQDIETEEIAVQIKEVEKSKIPDLPKKKERTIQKDVLKELVHCLPAEIKENYDNLYGEKRNIITFGSKFTMEVIFIQRSDLSISIWNNSVKVGRGSIIYIPKDRRWWKVTDVSYQNNGNTMICVPSDLQPSFE